MDVAAKFLSNSISRDKLNRFVQYYCKLLVWIGGQKGWEKEKLERLTGLMVSISQSY
jgi:hypothetical protein